jgi:signal transduction histidine kinase
MAAEMTCFEGAPASLRQMAKDRIAHQVGRMNNMLQELIEFTKPSGHQPVLSTVNFTRFMQPLVEELSEEMRERRVAVVLQNSPPELNVQIEPQRLSRLFYNLFNNAGDEMAEGGTIFLRFFAAETELRIEVEDTGKGISPQIASSLFQPFATHGKTNGSGLGLSICRKIAEDHGGKIWVESTPGKGATFAFTLPLSR